MNSAEQLYYSGPVQWVKVVKSIGTLAVMAFQGKVQWLWRHTISKVICSDRRCWPALWTGTEPSWSCSSTWSLLCLLKILTSTCPSNHKNLRQIYISFPTSLSPSIQWQGSWKSTGHLGSLLHFLSNSQLPGRLTLSSSSFPILTI